MTNHHLIAALAALALSMPGAFAQHTPAYAPLEAGQYSSASAAPGMPRAPLLSQQDLDRILAPIALYPDALLSQVLMAATFPAELAEAAAWSRSRPGLTSAEAMRAVEHFDWDDSVKSLAAFPQVLAWMDENRYWTHQLGGAFLVQEPQLMDTVQALRRRALVAGTLQSTDEIRVDQQDQNLVLMPAQPHIVHVPYYDPRVAYGLWWWPASPPVYWAPPRGYSRRPIPGAVFPVFWWGLPIAMRPGFFIGGLDWRRRSVPAVNTIHPAYRTPAFQPDRSNSSVGGHTRPAVTPDGAAWRDNPGRGRSVVVPAPTPSPSALPRAHAGTANLASHAAPRSAPAELRPVTASHASHAGSHDHATPQPPHSPGEQSRTHRQSATAAPERASHGGVIAPVHIRPGHDARTTPPAQRREIHREPHRPRT